MPYSKRWNLMHFLGGKCVQCKNENFYDLEIDHIYDDGDGERKYYTRFEQRYLDNIRRARERLQILCKNCHEKKHSYYYELPIPNDKIEKMNLFMSTMKSLEGNNRHPIAEHVLINNLSKTEKFSEEEARNYIRRMLREASIYESARGCYNLV